MINFCNSIRHCLMSKSNMDLEDYREVSTLDASDTGLLFVTPFTIHNFLQDRPMVGANSLAVVLKNQEGFCINDSVQHNGQLASKLLHNRIAIA
ncbi:MAG: hypothetical protein ACI8P9_002671 [Parasphingorhabdus sp.]